jgi:hypothetical protein
MRASVHICLPLLGQRKAEFEAIADKYHVQIRGAHGEHTETNDGIFDISNKRRLGPNMPTLVQDMYDGVKAMIKREKELQQQSGEAPVQAATANSKAPAQIGKQVMAGTHLKKPEDITGFVIFPGGTTSLLCKYLTPSVYETYAHQKDKAGVSFEQMILSGCQNVDSGIGCYAGSHDSYYSFSGLFDQVIQDYHGHGKNDKHVSDMDYEKLEMEPWTP